MNGVVDRNDSDLLGGALLSLILAKCMLDELNRLSDRRQEE
jgi:hypothetical protein